MLHQHEQGLADDFVEQAEKLTAELREIYALAGVNGLTSEQGVRLRDLSQSVHDLVMIKESYQKSSNSTGTRELHYRSLENMVGKVRQAMIYFKKDEQ